LLTFLQKAQLLPSLSGDTVAELDEHGRYFPLQNTVTELRERWPIPKFPGNSFIEDIFLRHDKPAFLGILQANIALHSGRPSLLLLLCAHASVDGR